MLSGDYRRAVAAEAAGDYAEAARHYALAGERDKVALMHVLRSARAPTHAEEIDALRDAMRWAEPASATRARAARALGTALIARARKEGLGTEKDRAQVREGAGLLDEAGDHAGAGEALELVGDDAAAAKAYERGGLLDLMEQALARDEKRSRSARRVKSAFEEYELHMQGGDRESAFGALRQCVELAESKGQYRRLLEELEAKRIGDGRLTLRRRDRTLFACAGPRVTLGRGPECALPLRSGGVSRVHAEIVVSSEGFALRDLGSRHGTWLGDVPLAGEVPLTGDGRFRLGEDCELAFRATAGGRALHLEIARGLDKGGALVVAAEGAYVDLLAELGVPGRLWFDGGRPYAEAAAGHALRLGGIKIPHRVQLVHGDTVAIDDVDLEVG